ncbi:sporozoite surface protein 2-like [Iris pallida]|uniref:Sporozoite surface protein 2-like n=1 Tax=Iris pallida TaxID=29817 RepID=A0AAX6I9C9_IRIPA|nr:sporozoite surface protein 2-like [Iris pallida]
MVQRMREKFKEYKLVNGGTSMATGDKQQPISGKNSETRDLPSETVNTVPTATGNSPLLRGGTVSDSIKVSGTKRQQTSYPSSPAHSQPPSTTGTNGHLVYVRRKLETESGKEDGSHSTLGKKFIGSCSSDPKSQLRLEQDVLTSLPVSTSVPSVSLNMSSGGPAPAYPPGKFLAGLPVPAPNYSTVPTTIPNTGIVFQPEAHRIPTMVPVQTERQSVSACIPVQSRSQRVTTSVVFQPEAQRIPTGVHVQPETQRVATGISVQSEAKRVTTGVVSEPEDHRIPTGVPVQPERQRVATGTSLQSEPQRATTGVVSQTEAQSFPTEVPIHPERERVSTGVSVHSEPHRVTTRVVSQPEAQRVPTGVPVQPERQRVATGVSVQSEPQRVTAGVLLQPQAQRIPIGVPVRPEPQRQRDQHWEERFLRLQMYLKNCNESSQEEYMKLLRSLSAAGRSKHAYELERRAIRLMVEEAKGVKKHEDSECFRKRPDGLPSARTQIHSVD